jgi:hypothetical protein
VSRPRPFPISQARRDQRIPRKPRYHLSHALTTSPLQPLRWPHLPVTRRWG